MFIYLFYFSIPECLMLLSFASEREVKQQLVLAIFLPHCKDENAIAWTLN